MEESGRLSGVRIALTYAGSILGAGYLSGQEIWQFFGAFGRRGIVGLVITLAFLSLLVVLIMVVAKRTGIIEMDRVIVAWDTPLLRGLAAVFEVVFIATSVVVMYAGGAELLRQLFSVPVWLGGLFMCVFVTLLAMRGLSGTVGFFSKIVPPMVVITVLFGIAALSRFGIAEIPQENSANPLLSHWLVSGITFASYNFFSVIGLMAPVGNLGKSRRALYSGAVLGSALLLVVALSVLGSLFAVPGAAQQELPMLAVAAAISPALRFPYGVVLFLAIFGSALYNLVAVTTFLDTRFPLFHQRKTLFFIAFAVFCYPASLLGFGDLISVIYPLIGYCSYAFIVCLVCHYLKIRKKA